MGQNISTALMPNYIYTAHF